jgi:hypothetical protein
LSEAYRAEADALDAEILAAIEARLVPNFDDLALRIFAHQLRYNEPYARYCASLGVSLESMPRSWDNIPPIPAGAFKEAALSTFDPAQAFLAFETSGTTRGARGKHYLEDSRLYDASLLSGFETYFLQDAKTTFRFLLFVPQFWVLPGRRQSSLGYMMDRAASCYGDGQERWFIKGETLFVGGFIAAAGNAARENAPVILAGTAFSFAALLDAFRDRGVASLPLPAGSKIMETGGFKGRTGHVDRRQLYADLERVLELPRSSIIAEYGMTELLSQYYDRSGQEPRVKIGPPWLRSYAVGENGERLPPGVVGALVHVDLANRSSCVAIQTEDLGAVLDDGGLVLIGRERGAELRGCSLDAESLRAVS